ncbi:MAG: GtrA family protein [Actinomycetota bacterium]|nr:GtrA family protein [Actinomycetota bacterium]
MSAGWLRGFIATHAEKLRYLFVGGWNTVFGYGLFLLLLALVGNPLRSVESSPVLLISLVGRNYYLVVGLLGWFVAVPQSTVTMKYLVFRSEGALLPQIGRAYFVYAPAQVLGTGVLWLTVRVAHLTPQIGGLVTIAVTTVFSYLGHKYFTFRRHPEFDEAREGRARHDGE